MQSSSSSSKKRVLTDEQKEKERKRRKKWNDEHKEHKKEYNKKWLAENLENHRRSCRNWANRNQDKMRKYNKKYAEENKERCRRDIKKWNDANKEHVQQTRFSPSVYVAMNDHSPYLKVGFATRPSGRLANYRTRDRTEKFLLLVPVHDVEAEQIVLAELRKWLNWEQDDPKSELFHVAVEDRDFFCRLIVQIINEAGQTRQLDCVNKKEKLVYF